MGCTPLSNSGSYKKHGELREITSDSELKQALEVLEEGFRLTVWAYDKEEVSLLC